MTPRRTDRALLRIDERRCLVTGEVVERVVRAARQLESRRVVAWTRPSSPDARQQLVLEQRYFRQVVERELARLREVFEP